MEIRMQFWSKNEKGQSIVIVALFFFFAFLVFAALSVDGTIIYLRRRQLQNMADAGALVAAEQLSVSKDVTVAYQKAMDSIAGNGGRIEWYSTSATPNPTSTNVGSGLDLIMGIEITDACDVRVALQWSDMGTYFAQFFGRETLQVGAKARAGCSMAGGLQPIAVKRFGDERDWNLALTNVNSANIYCDECTTQKTLPGPPPQGKGNATEFLRPVISDTITTWPPGQMIYEPPTPHANLESSAPGREYFILGNGVGPNVGTTSYSGLVNLDIRHVSAPPLAYFNGVDAGTNSNTLKDLAEYYIRRGYCCQIPAPGDQVAMYNGVSSSFAPQAIQETYTIGDVVAVIVYNGHVFSSPNLGMTGDDPNYYVTHPTTTTLASNALTYTLTLEAENEFQSAAGGITMGVEGLEGFADWSISDNSPILGRDGYPIQKTLTLVVTPEITTVVATTQVVTGTRMFYVSAIDNKEGGTHIRRYWAGIASIGDEVNGVQRDLPAVTCTPTNSDQNYPFVSVVKGQQAKYQLDLDVWGVASDRDVTVTAGLLPTGFEWVNTPPWTRTAKWNKHPGASLQIALKINDDAATSEIPHEIPLTVAVPGMTSQTCTLYVLVEEAGATVKEYVEILGYAALEITGFYNNRNPVSPGQPANAVRGRIVSELWDHPSEVIYGLRARLIPWDH
jgi:Flp pilus assembly protein TadG